MKWNKEVHPALSLKILYDNLHFATFGFVLHNKCLYYSIYLKDSFFCSQQIKLNRRGWARWNYVGGKCGIRRWEIWIENREWRIENWEWRIENGEWRMENGELRIENWELRIKSEELVFISWEFWIENWEWRIKN